MARSKPPKGRSSGRSKSSERWLARQRRDPFARQAAAQGRVSRAHFKLEQLDQRFKLLKPGSRVIELGAAPGGWTRYIEAHIGGGLLIACDVRPISAEATTVVVTGACGNPATDAEITQALRGQPADLVLSDMAPNISGIRTADQARTMELVALAEQAVDAWLKPGGTFVVKVFQGEGIDDWVRQMRNKFGKFRMVKPEASRPDSREMYAVAEQFRV